MKHVSRKNPKKEWYLGPNFLHNDKDGYLINPATNDIYWYHGSRYDAPSQGDVLIDDLTFSEQRASDTLYISSSEDTAKEFAAMEFTGDLAHERLFIVYNLKIQIPSRRIFDVRRSVDDPEFKEYASELLDFDCCETYKDAASEMNFEVYDYHFNTSATMESLLSYDFLGWLETEDNAAYMSRNEEDLTLALFQEYADHLCFIEDSYTFSLRDSST